MLDALAGPVAVVLEGKQHQPRGAARAAHGLEEDLGLVGPRPGIGIVVAVDDGVNVAVGAGVLVEVEVDVWVTEAVTDGV